ncbi:GGDEF domain-containing protein [Thiotrichales bacterium 19S3-7]|nr:GGDEF domain-containing protein [Thiotrichales bacterium 19S3-7]MCF6800944.1 GGDEF domain-containing protein [Thiotrichales bacterium 19S3-11]
MNELELQNQNLKKLMQNQYNHLQGRHKNIYDVIIENKRLIDQLNEKIVQLEKLARYDILTNTPNLLHFKEHFIRMLAHAKRHHQKLALLFLDLDKFKLINDNYGHQIGDLLLQQLSKRLTQTLRKNDFIARIGGDEFAVIVQQLPSKDIAGLIATKILEQLKEPFHLTNKITLSVIASIGISCYPDDALTYNELIKIADFAMYQAKKSHKQKYAFYQEDPQKNSHCANKLSALDKSD